MKLPFATFADYFTAVCPCGDTWDVRLYRACRTCGRPKTRTVRTVRSLTS